MDFDMTTRDGLRAACREAERRLDRNSAKVARVARFLHDVWHASTEERENRELHDSALGRQSALRRTQGNERINCHLQLGVGVSSSVSLN